MDFISALLGSIRGNDSWLIPEDYLEAATELVKPTYQGRDTSFQLRRRIHEVATAIRTNAAHRTMLLTDDCRIGLSYHPAPETGIHLGDNVVELFRYPCCSLHFILRPMDKLYHKMINVTSIWHTTASEHDVYSYEGNRDVCGADMHMRDGCKCNDEAKVLEEKFGLMVASDSITPEYLEEFKAQYKRPNTELYAIR
jgi:hypothetical protein